VSPKWLYIRCAEIGLGRGAKEGVYRSDTRPTKQRSPRPFQRNRRAACLLGGGVCCSLLQIRCGICSGAVRSTSRLASAKIIARTPSISRSGSVRASNNASAQKTCRPPGCAEIAWASLLSRSSIAADTLLLRASPQANSAQRIIAISRHHTSAALDVKQDSVIAQGNQKRVTALVAPSRLCIM